MGDRVSASIEIGGEISVNLFPALVDITANHGLALEWDAVPFDGNGLTPGAPLALFAHEVPGGHFDDLERFCVAHSLPFVRWCDGYPGAWNAERVVFTGDGEPVSYAAMEDFVVLGRRTADALGSYDAIMANFDAADFGVPPLIIIGNDPGPTDARAEHLPE